MKDEVHVSITEMVILTGKTKGFKLNIDDKTVTIPVDEAIFTRYQEQFYRKGNPTPLQQRRMATLQNLMRAAYIKGLKDAGKKRA